MKNGRGFTLIELLMVVSIVALLSSIVLASLNVARTRAATGAGLQFDANVYHAAADQAVGVWDLDECSSGGAADRSGNGNNGVFTNGATSSPDTPTSKGCSGFFDGSNDVITIPDATSMNFSGDVTLSAWIKPSVIVGNYRTFIAKRGATASYEMFLHTTTGALSWFNGSQFNSTYVPTLNQWTHVAGVINGTTLTMYANGQAVYKTAITGVAGVSGNGFYIGSYSTEAFSGLIDSVKVYSKSLTASDIENIYAAGLSKHPLAVK